MSKKREEMKRRIIAHAVIAARKSRDWHWAEDNLPPKEAKFYAVYDGVKPRGVGYTMTRVSELVAKCEMPIVIWL